MNHKAPHILRFSVVLFKRKYVVAKTFMTYQARGAYREHITRLYNAEII